jgi:hypothetical protein
MNLGNSSPLLSYHIRTLTHSLTTNQTNKTQLIRPKTLTPLFFSRLYPKRSRRWPSPLKKKTSLFLPSYFFFFSAVLYIRPHVSPPSPARKEKLGCASVILQTRPVDDVCMYRLPKKKEKKKTYHDQRGFRPAVRCVCASLFFLPLL